MTEPYVIWKPEHNGHAPNDWDGKAVFFRDEADSSWNHCQVPCWAKCWEYLYNPIGSQCKEDESFDPAAWLEQGRANLDKLPDGVVLPEGHPNWSLEVWLAAYEGYAAILRQRNTDLVTADKAGAAVIQSLSQPRATPKAVSDEWLRERIVQIFNSCGLEPHGVNYNAIELLRSIIDEAGQ